MIIAVGGEDDKVVLRSVESFDPNTNHWRTLACLPFAVSKHGLVVTGMKCYLQYFISFYFHWISLATIADWFSVQ